MSATIKNIDLNSRIIEFGCTTQETWSYKMFFSDQSEAELMELAQNVHEKFCTGDRNEQKYNVIKSYINQTLPSTEELHQAQRGEVTLSTYEE